MRPHKVNGVVVMDREVYFKKMYELLDDDKKFKRLDTDPTILREGQLQRFLRKLKKKNLLNDVIYESIYLCGSQPSRLYGLPKLHKIKGSSEIPPFIPIVLSIGSYNYMLAKYLCELLTPLVPTEYSTTDIFTFIKEIQQVRSSKKYGFF